MKFFHDHVLTLLRDAKVAEVHGRAGLELIREMDRIVNYTGKEPPEEDEPDQVGDLVGCIRVPYC